MSKSILVIEGDHADIIYLRKLINQSRPETRNMIWHEHRELRFNGNTTYKALSEILDVVVRQTEEFPHG